MNPYRIELQRPLHHLAAAHDCPNARTARRVFASLLPACGSDGMLVVIYRGREITPRKLLDHATQEQYANDPRRD